MIINHFSDSHGGNLNVDRKCDIVVHSGDFLPDPPFLSSKENAAHWQANWLDNKAKEYKLYINNKPFIFCSGNHDYLNGEQVEEILRKNNINATCINDKIFDFNGLKFYGFPWIKYINGYFNYELSDNGMNIKCNELKEAFSNSYINVLVAHGPMTNGLCVEGTKDYGNKVLEDTLLSLNKEYVPDTMLVGHIHLSKGIKFRYDLNMLIVNSATTNHIIEI